jgi:catechol 2,3-dioxygenase-like lactoylglutathione lyase family enzyme
MSASIRHVALCVPDLRGTEQYYQRVFDMELIGREALREDGQWYTLPHNKGWDDAIAAGIELGMLALQRGEIVLALFKAEVPLGQVFAIGLTMPPKEIARVRSRLPADTTVQADEPEHLAFWDPYRILWQINEPGSRFSTAGELAGRWLQLG